MQIDYVFMRKILRSVKQSGSFMITTDDLIEAVRADCADNIDFMDRFFGHLFLLTDNKTLEVMFCDKISFNGSQYGQNVFRLTSCGYDFLEALERKDVFERIKTFSLGVSLDVGKSLLKKILEQKIGL